MPVRQNDLINGQPVEITWRDRFRWGSPAATGTTVRQPAPQPPPAPPQYQSRQPTAPEPGIEAGIGMIVLGIILWTLGASHSLDGWVLGLNLVIDVVHLPVQVPPIAGYWRLLFIPLGIIYSLIEIRLGMPRRRVGFGEWLAVLFLLLIVHATDVGSTALFVILPPAGAWPLHQWAATVWPAAGAYSIGLTYLPEILIMQGIRIVRGGA